MRAQGAYFEGDVGVIAYVQCFLYHVSSSINVPIFRIIWLGTFWTDPVLIIAHVTVHSTFRMKTLREGVKKKCDR